MADDDKASPGISTFDWRKSPAHLAFLATFVIPRPPHTDPTGIPWQTVLGEPPEKAIERFERDKVIRPCGTRETLLNQLPKLTFARLKELGQERDLPMGKNKDEQVQILTSRLDAGLLFDVPERYLLQCADEGYKIVNGFTEKGVEILCEADPPTRDGVKKVLHWLTHDPVGAGVTSAAIFELAKNAFDLLKELFPDEQFSPPQPVPVKGPDETPAPQPVPEPRQSTPAPEKTPEPKQSRETGKRTSCFVEPEMVRIPSGYFWMGSDESDKDARDSEKPLHRLYLPEYWIGRYPVTVAEFVAFVRDSGCETVAEMSGSPYTWRSPDGQGSNMRDRDLHPVVYVSWIEAIDYCRWLSEITGTRYTLPSEPEWEKAARGEHGRIYPWGNKWEDGRCNIIDGKDGTTPVGYYSPTGDSPYGCADMAGNVWEWTRSLCGDYPYPDNRIGRSTRENPHDAGLRVGRGGSFDCPREGARCAYRGVEFNYFGYAGIGFRVVVSRAPE